MHCSYIQSVSFSEGLQTISENAFNGCDNIKSISFTSVPQTISDNAFYKVGFVNKAALTLPVEWLTSNLQQCNSIDSWYGGYFEPSNDFYLAVMADLRDKTQNDYFSSLYADMQNEIEQDDSLSDNTKKNVMLLNDVCNKILDQNYEEGFSAGYARGDSIGYIRGNVDGFAKGDSIGYDRGKVEGLTEGHKTGYTEGKAAGLTECQDALPTAPEGTAGPAVEIIKDGKKIILYNPDNVNFINIEKTE